MSPAKTPRNKNLVGIPLKERDPQHVREALAEQPEETVEQFVKLQSYAKEEHLGLTKLSHRTNIGTGILSQCFNGTYNGDCVAIGERINTFFWRMDQKAKYGGLREFCETRLSKALFAVFEKTRIIRRIQPIESPEQLGKTRVAVEYTARNNSGRTVYVQLSGGSRSGCGDLIWELAQKLDIPYTVKTREKRLRIKEKLESCDLVIIDEAHLIRSWTDASTRDFWDYLRTDIFNNGARGIVLISTNFNIFESIRAFKKRAHYNVGQLLGRMRNETMILDPYEDICESDIKMLVSRYYTPGKTALRMLHRIAREPQCGHFGLLEDIMNEAWTRAKANRKKELTDKIVETTATEIIATLKGRKELYS